MGGECGVGGECSGVGGECSGGGGECSGVGGECSGGGGECGGGGGGCSGGGGECSGGGGECSGGGGECSGGGGEYSGGGGECSGGGGECSGGGSKRRMWWRRMFKKNVVEEARSGKTQPIRTEREGGRQSSCGSTIMLSLSRDSFSPLGRATMHHSVQLLVIPRFDTGACFHVDGRFGNGARAEIAVRMQQQFVRVSHVS